MNRTNEIESSQSKSYASSYSLLENTYCGTGIPRTPYVTYNPPVDTRSWSLGNSSSPSLSCPADWTLNKIPSMAKQLILETDSYPAYSSLTHDAPYSNSGYFTIYPAYGNDKVGYQLRYRSCDGTWKQTTSKK